jgi:HPt (histidine-containing phosphotransfer) domain-containing protein
LAGAAATVGAAGLARRCRELQRGADSGEAGVRADLDAVAGHIRQVVATLREMAGAGAQDGAGQRA